MIRINILVFFIASVLLSGCNNNFIETEDLKALENENIIISEYTSKNNLNLDASGVYYKILNPNASAATSSPAEDFHIAYTVKPFGGAVIGSNVAKDSVIVNLYTANLFPGFASAILLLKEGEKGEFLVPSKLAYGSNPPANVPLYTPILCEIEIVDAINESEKIERYISKKKLKVEEKTSSGLRFIRLNEVNASAVALKDGDNVQLKYTGTFLSDKAFDSGTFGYVVGNTNLIPGFIEAVKKLKKGEKGKFILPYTIAYGIKGSGQSIPPYTPLVFDIEVVSVNGL
jgi:FKBP-type peptidyl-prolyl cis-trans isomerase